MIKIIFCAFNEAANLKKLLVNLHQQFVNHNFEIIACLDGTSDDSMEILQNFPALKILPIKNERGLGRAYKRIFLDVIQNSADDDLLISLDADNTHDPQQINEMIKYFELNKLDLLVASRFCDKSVMHKFPLYRRLISKITSLLLQFLFPIKKISGKNLQDYSSGYRVYRVKKLKELLAIKKNEFISEPEFTYTCELIIKLSRLNSRIDEIAISYDYGQKIGVSKLRVWRNFWRLIFLLVKLKKD